MCNVNKKKRNYKMYFCMQMHIFDDNFLHEK